MHTFAITEEEEKTEREKERCEELTSSDDNVKLLKGIWEDLVDC